jgi:hypothetical protein
MYQKRACQNDNFNYNETLLRVTNDGWILNLPGKENVNRSWFIGCNAGLVVGCWRIDAGKYRMLVRNGLFTTTGLDKQGRSLEH